MGDEDTKDVVVEDGGQPPNDDTPPDEGFGDAFKEASDVPEEADKGKEDKPTGEEAEVKGEEGKDKDKPPEKPEEKDEPPESLEQKYKTLQGMFNQKKEELDALKAAPPKGKEDEEPPPPDYTLLFQNLTEGLPEEILTELKDYEEEFDHISRFEGIKREQLAKRLIDLMNVSFKRMGEQLQPFFKAVGETAQSAHYTTLKTSHPDFEEIRDSGQLEKWIETQPKITQKAYRDVYKNGETSDVIELFDTFKKETGYKSDGAAPKGKEKKSDRGLEIVKMKEKGIPPAPPQPKQGKEDDFSSAFKEASNAK